MPHVPQLAQKLECLYRERRNSAITNHQTLADALGVSRGQIYNWLNGDGGMTREAIPDGRFDRFCELFGLSPAEMCAEFEAFRRILQKPLSGWQRLFDRATPFDAHNRIGLTLKHKGLAYVPDDYDAMKGERYFVGDQFRLELSGPPGWHVIVLVRDPHSVTCWCPSQYFSDNRLAAGGLGIPPDPKPAIRITEPVGQHWVLTVYTEKPLPETLYRQLYDDLPVNRELAIDRLEHVLDTQNFGQWLALRKPFHVVGD